MKKINNICFPIMTKPKVETQIGANVERARADVVATKLSIILSSFSFNAHTSKSEGSQRTEAEGHSSCRRSACAMGK